LVGDDFWIWRIDYHKFRGRGPKALENVVGADGIVQFGVDGVQQNFVKSSLFQAKKGRGNPRRLLEQAAKLRTWNEAAFFIRYEPQRYTAFGPEEAVKQALHFPNVDEIALDEFLVDRFVKCLVGDTELRYDGVRRELRWMDREGTVVRTPFALRHSLDIRVSAPRFYRGSPIQADEIPEHRMEATDEELLGTVANPTVADVNRARRAAARIYHSDRHQRLEPGLLRIFDLWMREKNAAADRVLVRLQKSKEPPTET
jgi:hypothetical protein